MNNRTDDISTNGRTRMGGHTGGGRGLGSQGRDVELWPCDACLRDHVASTADTGGSYHGRLRAYCPDLGGYVYSRQALREHRCAEP